MGSLLPTTIRIDASLLNWHHLSSTASFLILSSLLLGILSQVLSRRLKVPTPLSEDVSDILNRKRSYGANARKLLDKYYERVSRLVEQLQCVSQLMCWSVQKQAFWNRHHGWYVYFFFAEL